MFGTIVAPPEVITEFRRLAVAGGRQVLKLTCSQMLKLEDQRLLQRIHESGLRHVWYSVSEGQRLLDPVTGGREPGPSHDRDLMP